MLAMSKRTPQQVLEHTEKEVHKMDRILEKLKRIELQEFTNYLHSPWRIFWANFLAGTARGLGFLIGATLILTGVGIVITKILGNIPYFGEFFGDLKIWLDHSVEQTQQLRK